MTIAVASGKGGVGKSMLTSGLISLFSRAKELVAVDADVDAPNLHLWLGRGEDWDEVEKISTNERAVVDQNKCNLCGKCERVCAFEAIKVEGAEVKVDPYLCEGCGACEAVCPCGAIHLEPVTNAEIKCARVRPDQSCGRSVQLLSAQLYPGHTGSGKIVDLIMERAVDHQGEMIMVDCPAGTGCPVIAAVKESDFVVLVTEPTPSGLSDLERALEVVGSFQVSYGVVVNKWDINPSITKKIVGGFAERVLGKISYNKKVFEAISHLTPIMQTDLPQKSEIEEVYLQLVRQVK